MKKTHHQNNKQKSIVYTIKRTYLNLKTFVQANLDLKICISGYLNRNPPYLNLKGLHTVQLSMEGKSWEKEGISFRNRGQIEGIWKENREQNPFLYVQPFKGPVFPKHRFSNKYTIIETPAGTI